MSAELSKAETVPTYVFVLHGIPYLPHFQDEGKYVSPGYGVTHLDRYTPQELVLLGAKRIFEPLWPRAWSKKGV
jgi:hypothetical protein